MSDKIKSFGETVRELRESKRLLLKQVAAFLEVDTAFLSKMERNEKKASR
jgi:transcriptional regulator with XRE-family HTH domain